jgi:hypothetical protein
MPRKPSFVISSHADTGFRSHRLTRDSDDVITGHLDNFVGVHAVMRAYFSGRMNFPNIRIELTYGEETDMAGAHEVVETLMPDDVVVVVDVTGTPTGADLVIEKCSSHKMQEFIKGALAGMSYELYEGCPDPVAWMDESDVYSEKLENVFFLGVPCTGGDYNRGMVSCRESSVEAVAEALIRLAEAFSAGNKLKLGDVSHDAPDKINS